MAAVMTVILECDTPRCDNFFDSNTDDTGEARKMANTLGNWSYDYESGEDHCDVHSVS